MRCPKCSKIIPDSVTHCAYCGATVQPKAAVAQHQRSGRSVGLVLAILLLLCGLAGAAFFLLRNVGSSSAKPVRLLAGHTSDVMSVTFSPDGRTLASGAEDGTIRLWQVVDGLLLRTLGGDPVRMNSVAFSPDGAVLASGSSSGKASPWGQVRLWRLDDGSCFSIVEVEADGPSSNQVTVVAFSPDGTTLADGTLAQGTQSHGKKGGVIQLWHMPDRTIKSVWETGAVRNLAFSPDGRTMALAMADGLVELRHTDSGELVRTIAHGDTVNGVAFSPDGDKLASSGGPAVKVWQVRDGQLLHTLGGISGTATTVAFSPDGALLAAGMGNLGVGQVMIWHVEDGGLRSTFLGHNRQVNSIAFSPDGTMLASGADDDKIYLWTVR